MKTPNEIKKGLECCANAMMKQSCVGCPWFKTGDEFCNETVMLDALAYIQQLEAELAAVKRERDAAAKDLWYLGECYNCKHRDNQTNCNGNGCCYTCELDCPCAKYPCGYEWRGICQENTEVKDDVETR